MDLSEKPLQHPRVRGFLFDWDSADPHHQFFLPLEPGLTVLYGLNGAGKSRTLAAIANLWFGAWSPEVSALVQLPAIKAQGTDGIEHVEVCQLHRVMTAGWQTVIGVPTSEDPSGFAAEDALAAFVGGFTHGAEPATWDQAVGPLFAEWQQQRMMLIRPVGTRDRPTWESAIALVAHAGNPPAGQAVDRFWRNAADPAVPRGLVPIASTLEGQTILSGSVFGAPALNDRRQAGRHDRLDGLGARLTSFEEDLDAATRRHLLRELGGRAILEFRGAESGLSAWTYALVEQLHDLANEHLQAVLPGAPLLRLEVGTERSWLAGEPLRWTAVNPLRPRSAPLALTELSTAEGKWAAWAIGEALGGLRGPDAVSYTDLLILDEPERALHRSAEARMAGVIADTARLNRGSSVLVATHSPEFLDHDAAVTVQVSRSDADGRTEYRLLAPEARLDLSTFGLNPSDLLRRQRGLLLVEGRHDQDVLQALVGDTLARLRVETIPMRGAAQLPVTIESQVLFDFTDAHVFVMLDNIDSQRLDEVWRLARDTAERDDPEKAGEVIRNALNSKVAEERWLSEWLTKAITKGRSSRVTPLGLNRQDVIEYLPAGVLVPGQDDWDEIRRRYAAGTAEAKTKPDFKTWVRKNFRIPLSDTDIAAAALGMDSVPDELIGLMNRIESRLKEARPTMAGRQES